MKNLKFSFTWVPGFIRNDFLRKLAAVGFAAMVTALVYFGDENSDELVEMTITQVQPVFQLENEYVWKERPLKTLRLNVRAPRRVLRDLGPEKFEVFKKIGKYEYNTQKIVFDIKPDTEYEDAHIVCTHKDGDLVEILDVKPGDFPIKLDKIVELPMTVNPVFD